jgi:hypothetical protein
MTVEQLIESLRSFEPHYDIRLFIPCEVLGESDFEIVGIQKAMGPVVNMEISGLIPIAKCSEDQLNHFCRQHGILTYHSTHMQAEELPWLALAPMPEDYGRDIQDIMADHCRIYDEAGMIAHGKTKGEAVVKLANQLQIDASSVV